MARSSSIRRQLRRFAQIGRRHRALLCEAAIFLALARLSLILVPFPRLAREFGAFVAPSDARAVRAGARRAAEDARLSAEVGWAVTRAARHLPFRAVCLPQAMAARAMLKRRGVASVMHFGAVAEGGKDFSPHAWLDAVGVKVTGYPVADACVEIGCFV